MNPNRRTRPHLDATSRGRDANDPAEGAQEVVHLVRRTKDARGEHRWPPLAVRRAVDRDSHRHPDEVTRAVLAQVLGGSQIRLLHVRPLVEPRDRLPNGITQHNRTHRALQGSQQLLLSKLLLASKHWPRAPGARALHRSVRIGTGDCSDERIGTIRRHESHGARSHALVVRAAQAFAAVRKAVAARERALGIEGESGEHVLLLGVAARLWDEEAKQWPVDADDGRRVGRSRLDSLCRLCRKGAKVGGRLRDDARPRLSVAIPPAGCIIGGVQACRVVDSEDSGESSVSVEGETMAIRLHQPPPVGDVGRRSGDLPPEIASRALPWRHVVVPCRSKLCASG